MTGEFEIIYEDNHLLGVYKPGGLLVQGDITRDPSVLDLARAYLKETYKKPGNVFVGLVHRIDRPVSGVVLLARTSKAASRLSRAFHDRRVDKTYLAVVAGSVSADEDELIDYVERTDRGVRLAPGPSRTAKESQLRYRVLSRRQGTTLLEVTPQTGRHHQIRVQLSSIGHPIIGDLKYGASSALDDMTIALHSTRLSLDHPVRDERVGLSAPPPLDNTPWLLHRAAIEGFFVAGK